MIVGVLIFAFAVLFAVGVLRGKATTTVRKDGKTTTVAVPSTDPMSWYFVGFWAFVGVGIAVIGVATGKSGREVVQRQAQFPAEPWNWNSDNPLIVYDQGKAFIGILWFWAIFANLISAPVYFLLPLHPDEPGLWIATIFPVLGLAFLGLCIYLTFQGRKFKRRELHLESTPVIPGQVFRARVIAGSLQSGEAAARLRLYCQSVSRSGKNSTTSRTIWEAEHNVPADRIEQGDDAAVIPVYFEIPPDARPTTAPGRGTWIQWKLDVSVELPGINFAAQFDVPVYVPQGVIIPPTAPHYESWPDYLSSPQALMDERITVEKDALGWTTISLPARRDLFGMIFLGCFFCIWSGLTVVVWKKQLGCFVVMMGAVDLLVLYSLLVILALSRRFILRTHQVDVENRMFGFRWEKSYTDLDVTSVEHELVGESSQNTYYAIVFTRRDGSKKRICNDIRSVGDAEWLVNQFRAVLWPASAQLNRTAAVVPRHRA